MSAVCAYGLDHLTAFSSALVAAMLLFANMMREDAKYLTVDIRKIILLAVFLLIACKIPVGNFLLTTAVAWLFLRLAYLADMIRSARRDVNLLVTEPIPCCREPLPLLPAFGVALVMVALFLCNSAEPQFIISLRESMSELVNLAFVAFWPFCLLALLWAFLERFYYRLKKSGATMTEGLGMGDVLVLPLFAAYLGMALFGVTLFLALLIQLGQYFSRYVILNKEAW